MCQRPMPYIREFALYFLGIPQARRSPAPHAHGIGLIVARGYILFDYSCNKGNENFLNKK